MDKRERRMERMICRKLIGVCGRKYTVSEAIARYDRSYAHYRALVSTGNGSVSSGELIEDTVAYVNALARYCGVRGVALKEIR